MNQNELKEVMGLLADENVNALLCDTPVAKSGCSVICGDPKEPGDIDLSDYLMLPKSIVGMYPHIFVQVEGESMIEAGYEPGDSLRVRLDVTAHDSDDVLILIDGRCTVKTLASDEDGSKWLVPRNQDYDSIPLTEEMNIRTLGVVLGVEKASVRPSYRTLLQSIRRTKNKMRAASKLSEAEVDERIIKVGAIVAHARQWYAVYRALLDKSLTAEDDFKVFCDRVKRLLPEHKHLPEPKELSRMAVQSFAKPIPLWVESNAPVSGSRFRDYLHIGLTMGNYLGS